MTSFFDSHCNIAESPDLGRVCCASYLADSTPNFFFGFQNKKKFLKSFKHTYQPARGNYEFSYVLKCCQSSNVGIDTNFLTKILKCLQVIDMKGLHL